NGYKVYWQDGGQLVPPQDVDIINEITRLDFTDIQFDAQEERIFPIDSKVDIAFLEASVKNGNFGTSDKAKENLKIAFTSLHGTSIVLIPDALKKAGYTEVHIVKEQAKPDGNFPTVKSPNPEEPEALEMALQLAEKTNADIVIGTDPDGDRLGIAVRDNDGKMILLNGNQTMVLMTDFLLEYYQRNNTLQKNAFIASTIVSTPMMEKLASHYKVECKIVLTGFKWIAKMIKDFPEQRFIGGGEESFGYLVGDFVRDKDAVTATLLACEIAAQAKEQNSSVYERLLGLYKKHGLYKEHLVSLVRKGIEGAEEIKQRMIHLRANPLQKIGGSNVISIEDYSISRAENRLTGTFENLDIPASNVLIYITEDGTKIAARPSGTEPKIKFYISVNHPLQSIEDMSKVSSKLDEKIIRIVKSLGL
nr:phospho-sugar mutase [Flavobacteriales bacterium]